MKLRRLFARVAVALALVSMVSILPHQAGAQSTSDLVWVATDLTPQALAHCTLNRVPCPTGSIRVVNFKLVPLSEASARGVPYVPQGATYEQRAQLANEVAPIVAPRLPNATPQLTCLPAYPWTDYYDNVYLRDIHTTINAQMKYYIFPNCTRQGSTLSTTHVSGPTVWKNGVASIVDSAGQPWANDGDWIGCSQVPHTSNFGSSLITTTLRVHTTEWYSSGSNCTAFDTYDSVDYTWAH